MRARIQSHAQRSDTVAPGGPLTAQAFEASHPTLVARAPCLDAATNPSLLLRPEALKGPPSRRLGGQLLLTTTLVGREVARKGAQHAAVQLDNSIGRRIEKGPIVRDDDQGRRFLQ